MTIHTEPQITSYLFSKAVRNHIPVSGTFELSPVCNLRCRMCYVRMTGRQVRESGRPLMKNEEWLALAKEAQKEGMLYLLLTGGEPFLYPGFRELYEKLSHMGFVISINTNGTMIDEATVRWLREYPPSRVNITLYGACAETYGRLCGNKQGYIKVKRAIEALQDAGISVKLNCSLTPDNADDLAEMVGYAKERGLILEIASYMFPAVRRGKENVGKNYRFTPREAARYKFEIQRFQYGEEAAIEYAQKILEGGAPPIVEECQEIAADGSVRCRAGRAAFWVTWDGQMCPCGMMESPEVTVRGNSFRKAWNELTELTEDIQLSGTCSRCGGWKICRACAAMAFAETGTFEKTPEYLCRMVNAMRQEATLQLRLAERKTEISL